MPVSMPFDKGASTSKHCWRSEASFHPSGQFNDLPEGGGDGATKHSPPKMPRQRRLIAGLLGSFSPWLPRDEVAFRLIVKLASPIV